jgi:hypothetical protein
MPFPRRTEWPGTRSVGALQRVASICYTATRSARFRFFGLKVPLMRVDLVHPAAQKIVLTLETVGDDKVRINSSSLESPLTILADQSSDVVGLSKQILVRRVDWSIAGLDYDSTGEVEAKVDAGYGPAAK